MLIYNFQKEFIGIDEQDLKILGFKNLAELRTESADFADLFIKIPGYMHNFVHTHWIDFIVFDIAKKDFKAVIKAKNIYYKCLLEIKIMYLVDSPLKKAYSINLLNLRALPNDESEKLLKDAHRMSQPEGTSAKKALFEGQDLHKEPLAVDADVVAKKGLLELGTEYNASSAPTVQETPKLQANIISDDNVVLSKPEVKIDLMIDEEPAYIPQPIKPIHIEKQAPKVEEKKTIPEEDIKDVYIYNPKVASDELGLPIDLIEEFLEDFVVQANDFQANIYKALDEENINDAKSLAHKLKGVAANLRIEDAFEVLAIANASNNLLEIKKNIDKFYKIMSKLSINQSSDSIAENSKPTQTEEKHLEDHDYDDNLFMNFEDEKQEAQKNDENIEAESTVNSDEAHPELPKHDTEYDKISAAKDIGIDNNFYNELFTDYMTDGTSLLDAIDDAIKNNKPALWKDIAHKLKGMSENMRIKQIIEDINILLSTDDTKIAQDAINKISTVLKRISKI
ncbi:Hpt domain-containing protein [Epsilonproteobacteria bacterium SCGC AD-311-C15]|nr:Hpt domain-containing protein [Epsilonproteobacteria bacterium SCGC AD-311-C15]